MSHAESIARKIGEVMGVDVIRYEDGDIKLGSQTILVAGEDPEQFCDELKALLTRKPALDTLLEKLTETINEEKRVYPRTRLQDMLADYHTARNAEVAE